MTIGRDRVPKVHAPILLRAPSMGSARGMRRPADRRRDCAPLAAGARARRAVREGRLMPDLRPRPRPCAGQPGDPAAGLRRRLPALLPAQPEACPLLGVSEPGDPAIPRSAPISTSAPTCRATGSGATASWSTSRPTSARSGATTSSASCSAARSPSRRRCSPDGLEVRHVDAGPQRADVPHDVACAPAGPFAGPLVVSMRPFQPADAIRAIQITSRFPAVHGAPVHIGLPRADRHRRSRQARLRRRGRRSTTTSCRSSGPAA